MCAYVHTHSRTYTRIYIYKRFLRYSQTVYYRKFALYHNFVKKYPDQMQLAEEFTLTIDLVGCEPGKSTEINTELSSFF